MIIGHIKIRLRLSAPWNYISKKRYLHFPLSFLAAYLGQRGRLFVCSRRCVAIKQWDFDFLKGLLHSNRLRAIIYIWVYICLVFARQSNVVRTRRWPFITLDSDKKDCTCEAKFLVWRDKLNTGKNWPPSRAHDDITQFLLFRTCDLRNQRKTK